MYRSIVDGVDSLRKTQTSADLAFGDIGKNSAPQDSPSGTLTAQNFPLYLI